MGEGPGQFNQSTGIVVDARQRIIVSDQNNFRIQVFDLEGTFRPPLGGRGPETASSWNPWDWPWTPGVVLYVADGTRDDVQVFDESFAFIRKFGTLRPGFGRMEMIESVSVGIGPPPHQDIYVSDEKNSRIHHFSANGTHQGTFGKQGAGPGMFAKEVEGLTFEFLRLSVCRG